MSIASIALIAWMIISLFKFFRNPHKLLLCFLYIFIFCSIFLGVGKVIAIEDYDYDYSEFSLSILFLITFVLSILGKIGFSKKSFFVFSLFEISMIIGLLLRTMSNEIILGTDHTMITDEVFLQGISLVNVKVTSYSVITFIKISMFLFCLLSIYNCFCKEDVSYICKKLYFPICIFLLLGIFEFFYSNFVNPNTLRSLVLTILGTSKKAVTTPYYRAGIYSILLTCMEPSSVCFDLLVVSCLLFANYRLSSSQKRKQHIIFFEIVCFILSLSTLAFTGVLVCMYILFITLKYCISIKRDFKIPLFLTVGFFCLVLLISNNDSVVNYFYSRLSVLNQFVLKYLACSSDSSIFSFRESLVYRLYSIFVAAQIFVRHPLFGIGVGTATSFSGFFYTLADIGIVGLFFVIKIWKDTIKKFLNLKHVPAFPIFLFLLFNVFFGGLNNFVCSITTYCILLGSTYFLTKNECQENIKAKQKNLSYKLNTKENI